MVAIENPVTDETKTDQPVKPSTNPDSENSIADDAPTSEAAATDAPPAEPEKDNDDAEAADDDDANVDDDDDDKDDADYQADDDDDDDPDADDDDKDALPADPAVAKDVVKHLVSSGKLGTKPLHAAAAADEADTIKNLLADDAKDKVDINEVDAYDYTAVHVAAERGSVAALQALAEAGADLERPTKMHNSRPLHYAAFEGHAEAVRALLTAGADVNAVTDDGRTALYQASFRGNVECVKALLESSADATIADKEGKTPAAVATETEVTQALEAPPAKKRRTEEPESAADAN